MSDGVCNVFAQHTTCALTVLTNEDGIAEDRRQLLMSTTQQTTSVLMCSARSSARL